MAAVLHPFSNENSDDDFCKVFFKIIRSGVDNNFEDIKSQSLGVTMKNYNKIERWKSVENFDGYEEGIISKSFGTSYTCNIIVCNEMGDSIIKKYDEMSFTIDDCLSPAWQIYETPKEGLYKKLSVSRRDAAEVVKFPNVNMEIVKTDNNKFALQLRIIK